VTPPLVAVTAMRSGRVDGLRASGHVASAKVLEALIRAGAVPLILSPEVPYERIPLDVFDAVVIPGGADVDPSCYGAAATVAQGRVDRVQDEFEIALARGCIARDKPLLAICRGMQVLNVALGGDLVGDLPVNEIPHRAGYHDVAIDEGALLAHAIGKTRLSVSTVHHQAVDRLGQGLRAVGRADDGVVEALEHENGRVIAVQWHPEDDAATMAQDQAPFDALVRAARDRRSAEREGSEREA